MKKLDRVQAKVPDFEVVARVESIRLWPKAAVPEGQPSRRC